jgi:hypothetical protein
MRNIVEQDLENPSHKQQRASGYLVLAVWQAKVHPKPKSTLRSIAKKTNTLSHLGEQERNAQRVVHAIVDWYSKKQEHRAHSNNQRAECV